jgi:hypothetical protein
MYQMPEYSPLAKRIINSRELRDLIEATIRARTPEVVARFASEPDKLSITFPPWPIGVDIQEATVDRPKLFIKQIDFGFDFDLQLTFGRAGLNASIQVTAGRSLSNPSQIGVASASLNGSLSDAYQWNCYENFLDSRAAAAVKAGYGSVGNGGSIFKSEVKLDTDLLLPTPNVRFQ